MKEQLVPYKVTAAAAAAQHFPTEKLHQSEEDNFLNFIIVLLFCIIRYQLTYIIRSN